MCCNVELNATGIEVLSDHIFCQTQTTNISNCFGFRNLELLSPDAGWLSSLHRARMVRISDYIASGRIFFESIRIYLYRIMDVCNIDLNSFSFYQQNLPIERFWVEVNSRVNYPIKHALNTMEEDSFISLECNQTKFFVSQVTQRLAYFGMQTTVRAWNNHHIPGK